MRDSQIHARRNWIRNLRDITTVAGVGAGLGGAMYFRRPKTRSAGTVATRARRRANNLAFLAALKVARRGLKRPAPRKIQPRISNVVKNDGTSSHVYLMKRKKPRRGRKKKSVREQLKSVKRLIPKMSTKTFRDFKFLCLPSVFNTHTVYLIKVLDKTILENYAKSLTKVDAATTADYSLENTSIKMSNYYRLMVKNNRTSNAIFSYAFYVCKDDDNEDPLDCLLEELGDRGYTSLPSKDGVTPGVIGTNSEVPDKLRFTASNPYHVPAFSGGAINRNWAIQGSVRKATMGPGDTTDLVWSRNNYTYKQEHKDQENAFAHIKGMSVFLVISIQGDLMHEGGTLTSLVGRGAYQFDCEQQLQTVVRYANPKGLHEVSYSDTVDDTGFVTPVHADNMISDMEQDALT